MSELGVESRVFTLSCTLSPQSRIKVTQFGLRLGVHLPRPSVVLGLQVCLRYLFLKHKVIYPRLVYALQIPINTNTILPLWRWLFIFKFKKCFLCIAYYYRGNRKMSLRSASKEVFNMWGRCMSLVWFVVLPWSTGVPQVAAIPEMHNAYTKPTGWTGHSGKARATPSLSLHQLYFPDSSEHWGLLTNAATLIFNIIF